MCKVHDKARKMLLVLCRSGEAEMYYCQHLPITLVLVRIARINRPNVDDIVIICHI